MRRIRIRLLRPGLVAVQWRRGLIPLSHGNVTRSLVGKKRSPGAPPPAPRLVVVVPWVLGGRLGLRRPPRRALRSGPLGLVAVCPWGVGPSLKLPGVFRRPVARPRRLLKRGEGCGGGSLPLGVASRVGVRFCLVCHCEPVTDVTGVAIRTPLSSLQCNSWNGYIN